jgi:phosphoribosylamine---glycine ligase
MKILIIGSGGRENAIAYKIFHSDSFRNSGSKLYCTVSNPGISAYARSIDIKPSEIEKLINFCEENKIDFTVVGPEIPLASGIVNEFTKNNLKIFGPSKEAAEIETSKIFSKNLMIKYSIPTARYKSFGPDNHNDCFEFAEEIGFPCVIKTDGLAAGKGVVIAEDKAQLKTSVKEFTQTRIFGESGVNFVLEEFLKGFELSIFAITDGMDYVILPTAQDHKKIGEGDTGKNTGGMGAYSPANFLCDDDLMVKIESKIILPVLKAMKKENRLYKGCLYCGLMVSLDKDGNKEPFVIEFNCRFGDPETQAVLPLIKSDFLQLLISSSDGKVKEYEIETYNEFACCVVLASKGYPDAFESGKIISGLDKVDSDCLIFHSGTKAEGEKILTGGGRVLSVVCKGNTLQDAVSKCYKNAELINFENKYLRRDIALKGLRSAEII